jgi:hypothetical protein
MSGVKRGSAQIFDLNFEVREAILDMRAIRDRVRLEAERNRDLREAAAFSAALPLAGAIVLKLAERRAANRRSA